MKEVGKRCLRVMKTVEPHKTLDGYDHLFTYEIPENFINM